MLQFQSDDPIIEDDNNDDEDDDDDDDDEDAPDLEEAGGEGKISGCSDSFLVLQRIFLDFSCNF
jgi:hypothetical protein